MSRFPLRKETSSWFSRAKTPRRHALRHIVHRERKRKSLIFYAFIAVTATCLLTTIVFGESGLVKYLGLRKNHDKLSAEIRNMEQEHDIVKRQVESLRKDPFTIEKYAREEYGLAKPREYIFQFQDDGR